MRTGKLAVRLNFPKATCVEFQGVLTAQSRLRRQTPDSVSYARAALARLLAGVTGRQGARKAVPE